jgi:hypothetical protein
MISLSMAILNSDKQAIFNSRQILHFLTNFNRSVSVTLAKKKNIKTQKDRKINELLEIELILHDMTPLGHLHCIYPR